MKAYLYDPQTNEFLTEYDCQPSPLEPGKFLMPANGTDKKPPEAKDGYAILWGGTKWQEVKDHRQKRDKGGVPIEGTGTPYWLPGDTFYSSPRYMKMPGDLPKDAILTKPEKTDEMLAQEVRSERDGLLSQTDVVIVRCAEKGVAVPAEWIAYREALRDIPKQAGFPKDVVFPEKPSDDFLKG